MLHFIAVMALSGAIALLSSCASGHCAASADDLYAEVGRAKQVSNFKGDFYGGVSGFDSLAGFNQGIANENHRPSAYPRCYERQNRHDPLCIRVRRREDAQVRGIDALTLTVFGIALLIGLASFLAMRWLANPDAGNDRE